MTHLPRVLDFWHLTAKLGRAAVVLRGEVIENWMPSLRNTSNAWQRY